MNARFLVNTVSSDPLIRADQACRDLVDEAKDYLLLPQERLNMQGPRTRSRKPIKSGEVLFAGLFIFNFQIISIFFVFFC
jgi:kelch-like protein 20